MTSFKAAIRKGANYIKPDGTCIVKIRVTHKRSTFYFNTNILVYPKDFNNSRGKVISGNNKNLYNEVLYNRIHRYRTSIAKIDEKIDYITAKQLKAFLLNQTSDTKPNIDFYHFSLKYISGISKPGTSKQYATTIRKLKLFHGDTLNVSDINLQFIHNFHQHLTNNGVGNGAINYLNRFSTLFSRCQDFHNREEDNIIPIPYNPFSKFQMPKPIRNSKKHFLTSSEFKTLKNYSPTSDNHTFAKDMFLLMFYLIGIESQDLYNLNRPSKDGYITYIRAKTEKPFHYLVQPEAQEIISKYKGKSKCLNVSERFKDNHSFLKFLNINLNLNNDKTTGIFPHLGINKKVTSKWSRHTWATFARNDCDISMDNISLALGHSFSNNQVTDVYIEHNSSKIDSTNRTVINFVNSL